MADNNGDYLRQLKTKPATLVRRLTGASVDQPGVTHCKVMGGQLGRLHKVGQSFQQHRDNDRGPHWWRETSGKLVSRISAEDAELLQNEVHFQSQYRSADLPCGVIHADLFRDNALFDGEELTGIIDFYYACNDALLYDLAVVVNDWCVLEDGALDKEKLTAFIGAYHQQRPLLEMERSAWPVMLRAGALRFWLSRMQDLHFPREGEITHSKDPEVFKRILLKHITSEGSGHPWI
jgi:homoserine kinase type II